MVDRDVVAAKASAIERALARIEDLRGRRSSLAAQDYEELVELNLQRAVQDAIDLAAHVVASERWSVVDRVAANFSVLEERGVLEPDLAGRLRGMVGFRNLAVHHYDDLDPAVVEAILRDHTGDLRELVSAVSRFFGL